MVGQPGDGGGAGFGDVAEALLPLLALSGSNSPQAQNALTLMVALSKSRSERAFEEQKRAETRAKE